MKNLLICHVSFAGMTKIDQQKLATCFTPYIGHSDCFSYFSIYSNVNKTFCQPRLFSSHTSFNTRWLKNAETVYH